MKTVSIVRNKRGIDELLGQIAAIDESVTGVNFKLDFSLLFNKFDPDFNSDELPNDDLCKNTIAELIQAIAVIPAWVVLLNLDSNELGWSNITSLTRLVAAMPAWVNVVDFGQHNFFTRDGASWEHRFKRPNIILPPSPREVMPHFIFFYYGSDVDDTYFRDYVASELQAKESALNKMSESEIHSLIDGQKTVFELQFLYGRERRRGWGFERVLDRLESDLRQEYTEANEEYIQTIVELYVRKIREKNTPCAHFTAGLLCELVIEEMCQEPTFIRCTSVKERVEQFTLNAIDSYRKATLNPILKPFVEIRVRNLLATNVWPVVRARLLEAGSFWDNYLEIYLLGPVSNILQKKVHLFASLSLEIEIDEKKLPIFINNLERQQTPLVLFTCGLLLGGLIKTTIEDTRNEEAFNSYIEQRTLRAIDFFFKAASDPIIKSFVDLILWDIKVTSDLPLVQNYLKKVDIPPPFAIFPTYSDFKTGRFFSAGDDSNDLELYPVKFQMQT